MANVGKVNAGRDVRTALLNVLDSAAQGLEQPGPRCLDFLLVAGGETALDLGKARGQGDGLGAVEGKHRGLHAQAALAVVTVAAAGGGVMGRKFRKVGGIFELGKSGS